MDSTLIEDEHNLEEPVTDEQLIEALSKVYDNLCQNQRELDPECKRILYTNLRKLYLR